MIRSLRKGRTSVYFQHPHIGHSIGAEKYECEVVGNKAIFRFTLCSVDENQDQDEDYLHTDQLMFIDIDDARVIKGLDHYCEFSSWEVQVWSRGKLLRFEAEPKLLQHGTLHFQVLLRGTSLRPNI